MHVIGHDHKGVHLNGFAILEETMIKDQRTSRFRQNEFIFRTEGDEINAARFF